MKCLRNLSPERCRRLAMGALLSGAVVVAIWCLAPSARTNLAVAANPVSEKIQAPAFESPSLMARVPSDKRRISAAEIKARFPQEMQEQFMRRAIANSRKAGVQYKTGGAFGAVIVSRTGEVLADGVNHVVAQNDPTWHAEMHAIRQACALLKTPKLDGCVLYTSSEPCPMCLATAYWAGLDGIVYGATVADSKQYGNFDDDFIYEQFNKPTRDRAISEQEMLRPEAVEVWKEYQAREDKVDY